MPTKVASSTPSRNDRLTELGPMVILKTFVSCTFTLTSASKAAGATFGAAGAAARSALGDAASGDWAAVSPCASPLWLAARSLSPFSPAPVEGDGSAGAALSEEGGAGSEGA